MLNRVRQVYNYYLRPYLIPKGQDLVEYALLLAIVVGIGYTLFSFTSLKDSLEKIFMAPADLTYKLLHGNTGNETAWWTSFWNKYNK